MSPEGSVVKLAILETKSSKTLLYSSGLQLFKCELVLDWEMEMRRES